MNPYIFIDQDINILRSELKNEKKFLFKRLYEQCRLYSEENLDKEHPKGSSTYMGVAAANLSLAYLLTNQDHYLEEAKRWILTAVNYPHWGHAFLVDVDLSAAWMLFGLGLSYNWLYEDLTGEERTLIKDKLVLQATRMYDFKVNTEGNGWSTNYWQNHNWINMNGLATVGYALVDEYPQAQEWIDSAKENFEFVFSTMPEDGSNYEGVVYWRYGTMWLFIYAHLLKEREGINYFEKYNYFENTFYYRLYQSAPNLEEQINFGDCHDRRSGHSTAIYYKVASEYKNGHAQKLGNMVVNEFLFREAYESKVKPGILPEILFELLFYDADVKEQEFDDLDTVKYFEDLGLIVVRDSWAKDAVHFSFKTSMPGGKTQWKNLWQILSEKNYDSFGLSHQHPDNNSFIINASDTFLAIDDGYNRHVKASDHNVVIVDGYGYRDEGQNNIWKNYPRNLKAGINNFINKDEYVYFSGETANFYKEELKLNKFERHVVHTRNKYFIIFDELTSEVEHTYTWIMHSDVYPSGDGIEFTYKNGPAQMKLYNLTKKTTTVEFKENVVKAVMTTQEPDKYRETKMKGIYLSNSDKAKNFEFLNIVVPTKIDEESLVINKIEVKNGYGVSVKDGNKEEIFLVANDDQINYRSKTYNTKLLLLKLVDDKVIEEHLL